MMDGWLARWMCGWVGGWLDGWLADWLDGWMDGLMAGRMDETHAVWSGVPVTRMEGCRHVIWPVLLLGMLHSTQAMYCGDSNCYQLLG